MAVLTFSYDDHCQQYHSIFVKSAPVFRYIKLLPFHYERNLNSFSLSASIATFASPPIPASSPINVQNIVLKVVGIPSADIGLIIAIDWVM